MRRRQKRSLENRRGVALLAALWLVIAIATVSLQFALEARERRTVGILASERGIQRAADLGALAMVQAKLDYAARVAPSGNTASQLRSSDPWLGIDSTYSGEMLVDSIPVEVTAMDLGEKLNINQMTENDLRAFFGYVLKDFEKATELSQTIMDWRDADSLPRPQGAERDDYIKDNALALPTNGPFRDVEDMRFVKGMTAEIYAQVAPFFTVLGDGRVNVNSAPIEVLRAVPGMTDALINSIIQARSGGRRIDGTLIGLIQNATGGARGGNTGLQNTLAQRLTEHTTNAQFIFEARVGPQAQPSRLKVVLFNNGQSAPSAMTYKQW